MTEARAGASDLAQPRRDWSELWLVLGSLFYLSLSLFNFRGVPFLLGGDQVFFWTDAERMLQGQHIYTDFFQFTPPGTDLVYLRAFKLFHARIWAPNLIVLALGVLLAWLCFRIASHILERRQALLAAALFVVFLYGKPLNATHAWFSEAAVLGAVAVLMRKRSTARIGVAGILLGVATFFTQTRGPAAAAGIALYFLWDRWRSGAAWTLFFKRLALLAAPMLGAWVVLSWHFIAAIGLRQLWYWQVEYSARFKVSGPSTFGFPGPFTWGKSFQFAEYSIVYLLTPLVYLLSLLDGFRQPGDRPPENTSRVMLLALVGTMTALEVAQSPNWLRVFCVAAPAILLMVWIVGRWQRLRGCVTIGLWAAVILLALGQSASRYREARYTIELPSGTAAMSKQMAEKMTWLTAHTQPGDDFFDAPWPGLYMPLELRIPVFAESLRGMDESRPEFVTRAIQQLEDRRVQYVIWSPRLDVPEDPARPETYHLAPLRDFLHARYRRVMVFPDQDEVWERI